MSANQETRYKKAREMHVEGMVKLKETKDKFNSLISELIGDTKDKETRDILRKLLMYNDKIEHDTSDLGFLEGTLKKVRKTLKSSSKEGGSRKSRNKKRGTRRR